MWYLLQEKLKRLIKYLNFKEIKNKTQKQTSQEDDEVLEATGKYFICRVFSLIWAAAIANLLEQVKRKCLQNSTPAGLVWYTNMATFLLFWDTNMPAVMSCEHTL